MILSAKNNLAQSFLSPDLELGRKGSISSRVSGYEIGTHFSFSFTSNQTLFIVALHTHAHA